MINPEPDQDISEWAKLLWVKKKKNKIKGCKAAASLEIKSAVAIYLGAVPSLANQNISYRHTLPLLWRNSRVM